MMRAIITILFLSLTTIALCQENAFIWHNPLDAGYQVIEGQAWHRETTDPYDRLPSRVEPLVRKPVHDLSKQSAGLMIRFRTNAKQIKIRYQTGKTENYALNHMPATGVSGVDLYSINTHGVEQWCKGFRSFKDTVLYTFSGLTVDSTFHNLGPEYRLYLPLYNQVKWLEVGVGKNNHYEFLPVRLEKPIVVYGTSIAQGACASRPGMAWTSILGRKMDRPLINLGFSGNGLLEDPIIDLLTEIDAKVYVLDCLPNLIGNRVSNDSISVRVRRAVKTLQAQKPNAPILLVDHAGYTDGGTNRARQESYEEVNQIQTSTYNEMIAEGLTGLYYLTEEEIGLGMDDMVDGTHPTDLGMLHYAEAYEAKLRTILHEEKGTISTTNPVVQYREPLNYDWQKRHREILEINKTESPRTIIIANSIIQFWGGNPKSKLARDRASWQNILTPAGVWNYAYGWDRLENVLWRIYHGELDGFSAEKVLLMIGTNNLHLNTNEEILEGLSMITKAIKQRQPSAEIVLMGILPRRDYEGRIKLLNEEIAKLAGKHEVNFADLGHVFLAEDDKIQESLFSDGLHPNKDGYQELIKVLEPLVK